MMGLYAAYMYPIACCKAVVSSISISLNCKGPYRTAGKLAVIARPKSDETSLTKGLLHARILSHASLSFCAFFLGQVNSLFYGIKNKT